MVAAGPGPRCRDQPTLTRGSSRRSVFSQATAAARRFSLASSTAVARVARMAFTCEAVAGRGLGWFVNWLVGILFTLARVPETTGHMGTLDQPGGLAPDLCKPSGPETQPKPEDWEAVTALTGKWADASEKCRLECQQRRKPAWPVRH